MDLKRSRWNIKPAVPNEVCGYVSGQQDAAERLRWQEQYLQTGSVGGVQVLSKQDTMRNRGNTIFLSVYATYNVVVSIVFPPLVKVDTRTGQCLYDRACISVSRLMKALSGKYEEDERIVGGHCLPAPPKILLTVLVHQGDHAIVDCLCQDVEVGTHNIEPVVVDLMVALKAAEERAYHASRELRQACTTGRHNPYHEGTILDILECASQRMHRHSEGCNIFSVVTDFTARGFCGGAVIMPARERVALVDAQLVLIHLGNDVSQLSHINTLLSATNGVLVDWDYIDQTGTKYGTTAQPEINTFFRVRPRTSIWSHRSEKALQTLLPVTLAAIATCYAVYYPSGDAPSPESLFRKLRKAVMCRVVSVISKEGNIALPWPLDTSEFKGAEGLAKQEALGRVLVSKWSVSVHDVACLLECRVREGWTALNSGQGMQGMQMAVQAAMSWATGRSSRWATASLLYEVGPQPQAQITSMDTSVVEISVWAYGPRPLVTQYEKCDESSKRKKEEGPSKDVQRLREFMAALQNRDRLISSMLRERAPMKDRSLTDKIIEHSSEEGCSLSWLLTSNTYSYTALLSDTSGNEISYTDSIDRRYHDPTFERHFDGTSFVQGIMQKWPSGIGHITDSARAGLGTNKPFIRRLSTGGVLVAQFFIQKIAEGQRLPLCIEVRVSFFNVLQTVRSNILADLRKVMSEVPMNLRAPGMHSKSRRYHQRSTISVALARDELAVILRDVTNGSTETLFVESVLHDTSDTDAYVSDQARPYTLPNARKAHRHVHAITPMSYQYTHRKWSWLLSEGRSDNLLVFNVLLRLRSRQGFVLVHSRDSLDDMIVVMYKGVPASKEAMVIYACQLRGCNLDVKVWLEQSDRGRTATNGGIAFSPKERRQLLERMYLEHNVVVHLYATFMQQTRMVEVSNSSPTVIQHAKTYMRTSTDHEHTLYDVPAAAAWSCLRCRKRQALTTPRWYCTNCRPPQEYNLCQSCMVETESHFPFNDMHRFSPPPGAPPTIPLWREFIAPKGEPKEALRLPQIDLILRGSHHKMLVLPCLTDPNEESQQEPPADEKTPLSEPLVKLLDALQDGDQHEILARAKGVLVAPDTPTMKRAKAVLGSEPWRLKSTSVANDLHPRINTELRTQLLSAIEVTKKEAKSENKSSRQDTSSVGGCDDDRWSKSTAGKQLYSRVLNCIKLLCPVQIDVSQSDFPGGQYPKELVPLFASSLASAPSLHCFVRHSDMARAGEVPVTTLIITILASVDSAKPVSMNDDNGKPTHAFAGVVHEVAQEHLKWDVVDESSCNNAEKKSQVDRSPRTGSAAFKKFMETSHRMIFSFGVYRMLQCGEAVTVGDVKRALSACVDYVSEVEVTDLVNIYTRPDNAVPHEQVNTALKSVLDKNFGPVKGTECHYFFRGRCDKPNVRTPTPGNRPSNPSSKTAWPRITPSIASSAAAPPSLTNYRPANEGLTTHAVAQIPSATGLPLRPPVAPPADQLCEFPSFSDKERNTQVFPDDVTSFPSASSLKSSTEGLRPDCDSPRLGDAQSRLDGQSACFEDSESEESDGVEAPPGSTTTPNPSPQPTVEGGDDLPLFLMMTVTYEVIVPGKKGDQIFSYVLPVNHCVLDSFTDEPLLPVVSGTFLKATLSLIASSIPRQYFELSEFGFRPNRREAIRRCMVEVPGTEPFRGFSRTREAYVRRESMQVGPQVGPQLEVRAGIPYQFFPHRPKKLMERTMRRVTAEVQKAQLENQLTRPMSSEPAILIAKRIEQLRPKTWSRVTFKLVVLVDPMKKQHMKLYFREWLAESPDLRISKPLDEDLSSPLVLSLINTPAEDACVTAGLCLLGATVARTLEPADRSRDTETRASEQGLPYWLLLKLMGVKPIYRGPGGVHGLGMDKSIIKLRVWLYGPECLLSSERRLILAKVEKGLRTTVISMNKALLLEDCYALNPHCISDLLVPPDMKQAIRYIALKTAVCILTITTVQKRTGPLNTPTTTPQGCATPAPVPSQKPRGKPASVVRPPSVTGESVQSFSQTVASRHTHDSTPPQGWLVSRDSIPTEPWERWGGLTCKQYIIAEQHLGSRTEASDVDACLFHVWNNWQCDNRMRTYLWRGGKDEVYYFQFKLTEFVSYMPYKLVAIAAAAVSGLAVESAVVHKIDTCATRLLLCAGAVLAHELKPGSHPPKEPPKEKEGPPKETKESQEKQPEVTTPLAAPVPDPLTAHELERGTLRATMMIYSVRPPPDEITLPLAAEFKGCMRSATVISLGCHLQMTGGKLETIDLMELQQRAERSYELVAFLPEEIKQHSTKVLAYAHAHMRKWATQVQLTSGALPGIPKPHFIYPRITQSTRGASADTRNNHWLACLHVSLVDMQPSELSSDWGCLGETCNLLDETGQSTNNSTSALKFMLWVNGDTKELDPAVAQLKEALQSCVVQVFCEAAIEEKMPELEAFTTADFEIAKQLCSKAQGQSHGEAKYDKRKAQERQESCVQRAFKGTIQPSLAAALTHDVLLFVKDLHSKLTNEPTRNKLQPVAFYAVPTTETIVTQRDDEEGTCSKVNDDWSHKLGGTELYPLPDFSASTLKFYHDRVPQPAVDFYILCGRGATGEISDQWAGMHAAQCPEDAKDVKQRTDTTVLSEALRYYGSESPPRPCLLAIKVSSEGINMLSYNFKGTFIKGVQAGITSIVTELQKRVLLQSSVLHQKMGLFLPGHNLFYPHDSLLFRENFRDTTSEVGMGVLEDVFTTLPYNKETLEAAFNESTGRVKMGGRGVPLGRGQGSQPTLRRQSSHWLNTTQSNKTQPNIHSMLLGVGGVSSRAALVDEKYSQIMNSGRMSSDIIRHLATFKDIVAAENQAAQQLRARDAVRRDVSDFREAIQVQWPTERTSFLLYCPPSTSISREGKMALPFVVLALASCISVVRVGGQGTTHTNKEHAALAAYAGSVLVVVVQVELVTPKQRVEPKYQKIITGKCPADAQWQYGVWPAYYASRSRMKGFIANCIRMRQSSRLYHCQRVPFLLNKARAQLLLGNTRERNVSIDQQPDMVHVAAWKQLLSMFMRDYVEYLTAESEKKLGGVLSWVTACVIIDELVGRQSQDDEVLRGYISNCARLHVNGTFVACSTMSFFAVTEVSGGILLLDLSVRESCFALEFYLFDAAANASRQALSLTEAPAQSSRSHTISFHKILALIRAQLHMNSVFYDLQVRCMHKALRGQAESTAELNIDWLSVIEDSVQLYERPPLYSVSYLGCKKLSVVIPPEILTETNMSEEDVNALSTDECKKALGRFFAYVCRQSDRVVVGEDKVALLMFNDNMPDKYECDGVAVCRFDKEDRLYEGEELLLPLDVYVICTTDTLSREGSVQLTEKVLEGAYEQFREEVKKQCDDTVRNYKVHRLWKRLLQRKITGNEVCSLLGRSEGGSSCRVAKREVVPDMDPAALQCLQDVDFDTWIRVCEGCCARHNSDSLVVFSPQSRSAAQPPTTLHWIFAPNTPSQHPNTIIIEFTFSAKPPKHLVSIWWCTPRADSEHPAAPSPSPVLSPSDAQFFTDWVEAVTETLWAIEC